MKQSFLMCERWPRRTEARYHPHTPTHTRAPQRGVRVPSYGLIEGLRGRELTSRPLLPMAGNRSFKSGREWVDDPSFFSVQVWGKRGEFIAKQLRKGDRVVIGGRLDQAEWTTADGEKRSVIRVTATHIESEAFFREDESTPASSG